MLRVVILWSKTLRSKYPDSSGCFGVPGTTQFLCTWEMGKESPQLEVVVACSRSRGCLGTPYVMLNVVFNQLFAGKVKKWILLDFFKRLRFGGNCVCCRGLVARSQMTFANRGWVCASLLSSRLGLTSQLPMGTPRSPPLCTTSTPWGQTSTCQPSGLSDRSSRTMTRKHPFFCHHPCFADVFLASQEASGMHLP